MSQLFENPHRTWATSLGIAFSSGLIVFQGSLLWGFMQAGMNGIERVDGDIWVAPQGIRSFDFSVPLRSEHKAALYSIAGVRKVQKLLVGFSALNNMSGLQHGLLLVGVDSIGGVKLEPVDLKRLSPNSVLVDSTSTDFLGLEGIPSAVEINGARATIAGTLDDISTFIGSPYAFTSYESARRWMGVPPSFSHFFIVHIDEGADLQRVIAAISAKFDNTEAMSSSEFAWRSSTFWLIRTGAGGGLLMAGIVGAIIGFVIISQTAYGSVVENYEQFAMVRALGGSVDTLRLIVLCQSVFYAAVAGGAGIVLSLPAVVLTRALIVGWIETPVLLVVFSYFFVLLVSIFASRAALAKIETIDPAIVFRS